MQQMSLNDIKIFIETVLAQIKNFFDEFVSTTSKRCYLIANWLKFYFAYLRNEQEFLNKKNYKTFKYGQVIRVSFGFNIGHELGGIHYAIVINNDDSPYSSDLIVIPLSSKHKEISTNTKESRIDIGFELKNIIKNKIDSVAEKMLNLMKNIDRENIKEEDTNKLKKFMELYDKLNTEYENMSDGSIILTKQIRFITKMRIMAPTTKTDYFNNIILSTETMHKITDKLKSLLNI